MTRETTAKGKQNRENENLVLKKCWMNENEQERLLKFQPTLFQFSCTFYYKTSKLIKLASQTVCHRMSSLHCSTVPGEKPSPWEGIQLLHREKESIFSTDKFTFSTLIFYMAFTLTLLLETYLQRIRKPSANRCILLTAAQRRNSDSSHVEETPTNQSIFQC